MPSYKILGTPLDATASTRVPAAGGMEV